MALGCLGFLCELDYPKQHKICASRMPSQIGAEFTSKGLAFAISLGHVSRLKVPVFSLSSEALFRAVAVYDVPVLRFFLSCF